MLLPFVAAVPTQPVISDATNAAAAKDCFAEFIVVVIGLPGSLLL
jgi:hypothetical protein